MQPKCSVSWQAPNCGQALKGSGWTVKIYTGTPLIRDLAPVFPVEKWDVSIKDLAQGYITWIGPHVFSTAQGEWRSMNMLLRLVFSFISFLSLMMINL